jgi:hypothetical protein
MMCVVSMSVGTGGLEGVGVVMGGVCRAAGVWLCEGVWL